MKKGLKIWLVVVIVVVVLLILGTVGSYWVKGRVVKEVLKEQVSMSLIYWDKVKVGDKVGELTVQKISGLNGKEVEEGNLAVEFSGQAVVTGTYFYAPELSNVGPCISFEKFDQVFPVLASQWNPNGQATGAGWFCFSNPDKVVLAMGAESRTVKILIKDYRILSESKLVTNKATFVQEIK